MKKILMKKIKKYFYNFFYIYKNDKEILSKKQKIASKRSTRKVPKSFWRRQKRNEKRKKASVLSRT